MLTLKKHNIAILYCTYNCSLYNIESYGTIMDS